MNRRSIVKQEKLPWGDDLKSEQMQMGFSFVSIRVIRG